MSLTIEPDSQLNLRHSLLTSARDQLHLQWEKRCDVEFTSADREERAPVLPEPPTTDAIIALAEEFYSFVTKA